MGYKLKYVANSNTYVIERIDGNRYDKSKLTQEVERVSNSIWICASKKPLIDFVHVFKEEQCNKHLDAIEKINLRKLVIR